MDENPEGRDWADEFLQYENNYEDDLALKKKERYDARVAGTMPSHGLPAYAGNYADKMYGGAKIELKDGKLWLEMTPTKKLFVGSLEHWHFDTFRFKFADPFLPEGFLTFEADSNGHIKGFTIDLPNPDFHFFNLHFEKQ
jgi:hypothetical protein